MDEIDLRITEAVAADGRVANSEIARQLGVSEGTVRQRLRKLLKTGTLKIQAQVNSEHVPNQYPAVIGLKLEGRELERFAEQINRFPEVQRVMIVTGRYDLLVNLLLDSHERLVDFVTHRLSKVAGIRDSETFVCLKNYDPWFPAACVNRSRPEDGDLGRKAPKNSRRNPR